MGENNLDFEPISRITLEFLNNFRLANVFRIPKKAQSVEMLKLLYIMVRYSCIVNNLARILIDNLEINDGMG